MDVMWRSVASRAAGCTVKYALENSSRRRSTARAASNVTIVDVHCLMTVALLSCEVCTR